MLQNTCLHHFVHGKYGIIMGSVSMLSIYTKMLLSYTEECYILFCERAVESPEINTNFFKVATFLSAQSDASQNCIS